MSAPAAVWQQVLALDAKYNAYRAPSTPQFRLYFCLNISLQRHVMKFKQNRSGNTPVTLLRMALAYASVSGSFYQKLHISCPTGLTLHIILFDGVSGENAGVTKCR